MAKKEVKPITIKGARLLFRNFAGKRTQFNEEGKRNFCVILPKDISVAMKKEGWNVKELKPKTGEDEPQPYLKVNVNYNGIRPPKIRMMLGKNQTEVTEETVDSLDWAEIEWADLILNPYIYEKRDGSGVGISAYLKTMYASILQDELEAEYADCGSVCDGDCANCHVDEY